MKVSQEQGTDLIVGSCPRVLSLCSGIGGLDLGIELAFPGARTVCFVEREAACCQVLVSRMEEGRLAPAPVWTDLKTFDGAAWSGCVDIVSAGYPCQPFSCAGARKGVEDPRHLWPEVRRIIRESGPALVVLENVQGHISKGLRQVLKDLMELGFDAEWGIYSAAQAGSPQRRNRVFVLAYGCGGGFPFERQALDQDGGDAFRDNADRLDEAVADTHRVRESGDQSSHREGSRVEQGGKELADTHRGGRTSEQYPGGGGAEAGGGEGDTEQSCGGKELEHPSRERPQGRRKPIEQSAHKRPPWPPGPEGDWSNVPEWLWPARCGGRSQTEPAIRGMVDGVPVRVDQLRALGNAVVPQQAALALRDLWRRIPQ